jgi:ATP-binding cassette, subfamily C (CFTR/MRP), member 4
MYAWEKPFSKFVSMARKKEIRVIRYSSWIRGILVSFIMFSSRASIFTSLAMYALLGNIVTAHQAFVITAYYNSVRQTMTIFFPSAVGMFAETIVSVRRLEKFMLYDELDRETQNNNNNTDELKPNKTNETKEVGIKLQNVIANWTDTQSTLKNINLNIESKSTVAIIGKVGSGKSTLLQTILGELKEASGSVEVNGKISYASQDPWLFSSSIRQNILFGQKYDKKRYKEVIKVCALVRDIELWPDGDKTIVGERGMSLSGGQKARINLARAIYREADIYLLDDPLSAVDSHVGRHLFDHCITEYLHDKLVIIVTHQLQFLKSVDQVVILNDGEIDGMGTYKALQASGLDFAKLLPVTSEESVVVGDKTRRSSKSTARQNSVSSVSSKTSEDQDFDNITETKNPQQEEARAEGSIGLRCYKEYSKASGSFCTHFMVILFFLVAQLFASGGDYFVSFWVRQEESRLPTNDTIISEQSQYDRNIDIYIFTGLTVGTIFFTVSRSFLFFNVAMVASRKLHDAMFAGVTRACMYFFNTNPSGRILNRFSKDIGQIDEILPMVMIDVLQIFLSLIGIVIVVMTVNPLFLVPTIFIGIIFYFLRGFYLKSSRDLKRLEATSKL